MTSALEAYALWLADYYLLATVLLAGALVAMAILKQPAQKLAVAKSSLVALILLAALCALPGWSLVHLLASGPPTGAVPPVVAASLPPAEDRARSAPRAFVQEVTPDTLAPLPSPPPPTRHWPQISWPALLALVHALGAACVFVWLAVGSLAARRLRGTAMPAPAELAALLAEVTREKDARHPPPELLLSDRIAVPVALGIRCPAILLPHELAKSAVRGSRSEIKPILAHELAHIRGHDLRWLAASRVLLALLWAQPLFWLLRRRMRLDQETLADAAAADLTSRQHYAEQLVSWARHTTARPQLYSAVGLWERPSQLRRRIALLLDERFIVLPHCSPRWRVASLVACALVAAGLSIVTFEPAQSNSNEGVSKPSANSTANGRVVENAGPVLRGRIADADGHPISDVQVVLYGGVATRLRGQETRTDEKGEFRFAPLKTGALRFPENGGSHWYTGVRFKHPEYVPADGSSWRDIDVPNITGHEEVLDLTMTPGGKVSGTVEDDKGGKVSELALRIYTDPDNVPDAAYFLVYATTDRHGRFESEALFPGRYTIDINSAIYQGQHRYPRIGRVMVREGETAEVRLNTPADNTGAVAQPVDLTFIIAEHVILHEGEIIEWDDVERLILEHPNPSLVHPAFRFTHGAIPTRQEEIRPKIWDLRRRIELPGHSWGSVSPQASARYDKVRTSDDLIPNEARRIEGVVQTAEGTPAAGAEVLLCLPVDNALPYKTLDIYLREFRLRNRVDDFVTDTDAAGRFAVYPPPDAPYYLVALHRDGFGLVRSDRFAPSRRIEIHPWARIEGRIAADIRFEQSANVALRVPPVGDWPELSLRHYSSDIDQPTPDGRFEFAYVPPLLQGWLSRSVKDENGRSIGLPYEEFQLHPGETLKVDIDRPTDADIHQSQDVRTRLGPRDSRQDADPERDSADNDSQSNAAQDSPGAARFIQAAHQVANQQTSSTRPPALLTYGDGKPDGKKSYGGSGHLIRFELPEGGTKVRGIRIHGSRYGLPRAPEEDFEITFLSESRDEILHSEAAPYRLFQRGKEQWVRVLFDNEVELPPKFWIGLNFNPHQTKGVYVSYDTSTGGQYSRVGLPGDDAEPKATDFGGDWMVQVMLARPER